MTRPDRPRQFRDALSGVDGTQAVRSSYQVLPVYPDASLGVPLTSARPVRPVTMKIAVPTIASVDPHLLAELAAPLRPLAGPPRQARPAPTSQPPARRTTPLAPGGVPAVQYSPQSSPSRQQAARATHYQGPVPLAVAPAAATAHNLPMTYAGQSWTQFPGAAGSPPPQAFPRATQTGPPALRMTPPAAPTGQYPRPTPVPGSARKKGNWIQLGFLLLVFLLIFSGLGRQLLDFIQELISR